MILLCKDYTAWLTNCGGVKIEKVDNVLDYLDTNVTLEEGITLKHIIVFSDRLGMHISVVDNYTDIKDDYEYISVVSKFTLDIKNNGVHIIDKSYTRMSIECDDGDSIFIFDYMITKQVLDLEIRIEREVIEYNDAKFFMPSELTLRELLFAISDGIIEE